MAASGTLTRMTEQFKEKRCEELMKNTKHHRLELPPFFSDGMILQRNQTLKFWGWDVPETIVTLRFNDQVCRATVDSEGYWEVTVGSQSAGGPYEVIIKGSTSVTIEDVYIGEVWLAGGQSNMELPLKRVAPFHPEAIEGVKLPLIRQFQVTQTQNFHGPQEKTKGGKWIKAIPAKIQEFSGVGFFFAKHLYEALEVPIGIYLTAVGGTPAEAWMSEESLKKMAYDLAPFSYLKQDTALNERLKEEAVAAEQWYKTLHQTDKGLRAETPWYSPQLKDDDWATLTLPRMFRGTPIGDTIGVVWLRKELELDAETIADPDLTVWLGTLIDADDTYLNGIHIGRTDYRYPPRIYPAARQWLKPGKNILAVRLEITNGLGGFIPEREYALKGQTTNLPLDGEWRYKVATVMEEPLKQPLTLHNQPAGLYNAILYPLRKLAIQGTIYYQGESNSGAPDKYERLMEELIKDWRALWGGDMPFYFVQLANYFEPTASTDDRKWAMIRDKQDQVSQKVEHTGLVSAIDVGEDTELHPPEKMTLGRRLANFALKQVYGRPRQAEHHRLKAIEETDESYRLSFEPAISNETVVNGRMIDIELQTADGKWVAAQAAITGQQLTVEKELGKSYKAIRYAWRNAPKGVLFDRISKLPVLPFTEKL